MFEFEPYLFALFVVLTGLAYPAITAELGRAKADSLACWVVIHSYQPLLL